MVQLNDNDYAKLKKDADDNRQLIILLRILAVFVTFIIIFFAWGKNILDLDIEYRRFEAQTQMQISQAETNVKVREIESEGMTFENYILWLEAENNRR